MIMSSTTGMTIQDFLQIYQTVNGQFSTSVTLMSYFVTALGVVTAVVIAFFAIRQINVDREIRKYRDEIKKQKEMASEVVERMKVDLKSASSLLAEAKDTKSKIEEEIKKPQSEETKKEIEKLQGKIEKLEEEITYKRGVLSASPGTAEPFVFTGVSDLLPAVFSWKRCGENYSKQYDRDDLLNGPFVSAYGLRDHLKNKCPHCGNIN